MAKGKRSGEISQDLLQKSRSGVVMTWTRLVISQEGEEWLYSRHIWGIESKGLGGLSRGCLQFQAGATNGCGGSVHMCMCASMDVCEDICMKAYMCVVMHV